MTLHMRREIERLKKKLIILAGLVEENLKKSIASIEEKDRTMAEEVIQADEDIDQHEIEVEEECLKVLALYQPVAIDLRLIVAILKINNDLERIGDLAVNICQRAIYITSQNSLHEKTEFTFQDIAQKTIIMFRKSLDALINLDAGLARDVCASDDEIDETVRKMHPIIIDKMKKQPQAIGVLLRYLYVFKHLERIADHATNIAEDTLYMIQGDIMRHGRGLDLEEE